ncbi:MAG: hypothetical protein JSV26_00360 [bacterium]|nr:MAG: hypothetical protein JSV26_00360 [bacterium]
MKEDRRHPRREAPDGSIAICGSKPFRLLDYSENGVGLRFYGDDDISEDMDIILLVPEKDLPGDELKCRKVYDVTMKKTGTFTYSRDRRIGLQFVEPQPDLVKAMEG